MKPSGNSAGRSIVATESILCSTSSRLAICGSGRVTSARAQWASAWRLARFPGGPLVGIPRGLSERRQTRPEFIFSQNNNNNNNKETN